MRADERHHRRAAASAGVDAARYRRSARAAGRRTCPSKGLLRLDRPHVSARRRARVRRLAARPRAARSSRLERAAPGAHRRRQRRSTSKIFPTTSSRRSRSRPRCSSQCAACRRLCVRDDFVWKEKQLCAWDYHAQVFGKRGPWHEGRVRGASLRNAAVVRVRRRRRCSDELGVEPVLRLGALLDDATERASRQRRPRSRSRAAAHGGAHRRRVHGAARGMTNRAIRDLSAFFVLLFAVLAIRQIYVQTVEAPTIAARPTNPRHAMLDAGRGRILATDGTVLAQTAAEIAASIRSASSSRKSSATCRRATARAASRDAFDRALTPPERSGDPLAQLDEIVATLRGTTVEAQAPTSSPRSYRGTGAALSSCSRDYPRAAGRRARSAHRRRAGARQRPELRSQRRSTTSFRRCCSRSRRAAARSRPRRALSAGLDVQDLHGRRGARQHNRDDGLALRRSRVSRRSVIRRCTTTKARRPGMPTSRPPSRSRATSTSGRSRSRWAPTTFYDYLRRWGIGDSLDFQLPAQAARVPPQAEHRSGRARPDGIRTGRAAR